MGSASITWPFLETGHLVGIKVVFPQRRKVDRGIVVCYSEKKIRTQGIFWHTVGPLPTRLHPSNLKDSYV